MKKYLLIIFAFLLVLSFGVGNTASAAESGDYTQDETYKFIRDFTEKFPNREAGVAVNTPWTEGSLQSYLRDAFVSFSNGAISQSDVLYQSFYVTDVKSGYNLTARLNKKDSDKQIIIGAHYDSKGVGANDNASGVTALFRVLSVLSADLSKLPCNVMFILFDGEELGMSGSYTYVANMSDSEKSNTLVMFNMDSIANGDNLYLWCENKHTGLADLILSKSDKIIEKPYAKGTYNLNNGLGYGYTETPQNSDHTPFRVSGIPTALFFSGTYSADIWNYRESENPVKNTMNSSSDTLENLDKYSGAEFVAKINATADAVSHTILDSGFVTVAEAQRSEIVNLNVLGNSWWARLICGAILAAVLVLAILYYRKLQKGAILGTAEIKTNKVFATPKAEDIFSFEDKKPKAEDIFTFDDKNKK